MKLPLHEFSFVEATAPFLLRYLMYPGPLRCAILFTQSGLEMEIKYEIYL